MTSHTFRHSSATHLLPDGSEVGRSQHRIDHEDVDTAMFDTQVLHRSDPPIAARPVCPVSARRKKAYCAGKRLAMTQVATTIDPAVSCCL